MKLDYQKRKFIYTWKISDPRWDKLDGSAAPPVMDDVAYQSSHNLPLLVVQARTFRLSFVSIETEDNGLVNLSLTGIILTSF